MSWMYVCESLERRKWSSVRTAVTTEDKRFCCLFISLFNQIFFCFLYIYFFNLNYLFKHQRERLDKKTQPCTLLNKFEIVYVYKSAAELGVETKKKEKKFLR